MRLAVLADIHGNRWALEAVLNAMSRERPDAVINLGDCFFGPLDPAGTFEILSTKSWPTVRGNQDREILSPTGENPTLSYTLMALGQEGIRWTRDNAYQSVGLKSAYACHGTPSSDTTPLIESVHAHGVGTRSNQELLSLIGSASPNTAAWQQDPKARADVVLCAHSHQARVVQAGPDLLVVNPGSVGLPAYEDDAPHPHVMEAGSPHARWALLERKDASWTVTLVATPYDWVEASRMAARNGRADWARWIQTGRGRA